MSDSILAMRERRNALAKEARNLLDQHPGAEWKNEHSKKFDEINAEIARIDADVSRHQKMLDIEAAKVFAGAGVREHDVDGITPQAAVRKWLRGSHMSQDDWAAANEVMSPEEGGFRIKNTMSGDPSNGSEGGDTVETDIVARVTEALKKYGGMRQVAEIIKTASGNPMNFPTSDGTSETGELVAENTAASSLDPSFGTVGLNVYKFSSKIITVPFELLQDSVVDIEQFIANRIVTRLGRSQNSYFTNGTGSSQPNGIVTAAASGVVAATGGATSVTYDNLIDLQHSVDPAYRDLGRTRYMFADSTLAAIRKLKDSQNRPLFIPGFLDNGIAAGVPDTLAGRPFTINQAIPAMAANAKSILFGDFSFYKIRDVMALTLFRFTDSAFASKGQVGFLAWMRSGGNLVDVGGPVKYFQNSAT